MDLFSLDNLAALSEKEAYQAKSERRNLAYVRPFAWIFVFVSIIELGTSLEAGVSSASLIAGFQGVLLLLFLLLLRRIPPPRAGGRRTRLLDRAFSWLDPLAVLVADHRSAVVLGFLASQFLLLVLCVSFLSGDQAWPFVFPAVVLFFRLSVGETVSLHGSFLLLGIVEHLYKNGADEIVPLTMGSLAVNGAMLAIGLFLTRRYREAFLREWRRAVGRHEDQIRMRNELEVARELQLSMLPEKAPYLDWLEIASLSQPAKEVGGDYYDYFPRPDGTLVVVAGDVAGHGLPSGLVLSGLRSCLTMLTEELHDPVAVMHKLDRMVRLTSRQRTLVTLSLVLLDPALGEISVTSAGHPPLLLLRKGGDLEEIGSSALPLGVGLQREFEKCRSSIGRGDVLVLYSDGIYEAPNETGEPYGLDRFKDMIRSVAEQSSATEIRNSVLDSLRSHQGQAAQSDDITLVVLLVQKELGSQPVRFEEV